MGFNVVYADKNKIKSSITQNIIPKESLILTAQDDKQSESYYYDDEGNLKFITKKTTFNSKIEARTWIARYGNYQGEIISIYQNNSYVPFLVNNNNELVPLQTGEEETADFNIIDGGAANTNY